MRCNEYREAVKTTRELCVAGIRDETGEVRVN